ncbi:type I-B CRISPR-associated protein Cas7/Cst2/DevR [Candidatus Nitrosocosmicus hydrocola]|uniref:type I-B CRISPR-associated protein Cas7/Cst2/DevR n=1 Tax=Candidatus Nitrosocosmicus hydrocola TaxID=1826872 RepID=UPI0011E5915D|nr:type I-B CRISPR-associated protein Cas7/Cst2/DevR [Candidatus Nitrosocosmicus hydrocola]
MLSSEEEKARFSFLEITFLTKVEKSIFNAAGNYGGNLTELKKTTEIDGSSRVFVSGSSMKWSIKKHWSENMEKTSPVSPKIRNADKKTIKANKKQLVENDKTLEKIEGNDPLLTTDQDRLEANDQEMNASQVSSACNPREYIDDDLFGYFDTTKKLARYAPVKTSGMISIFSVGPDIDNLVRFSPNSQDHALFDKEISTNVFRSSWAIEIDRVGVAKAPNEVMNDVDIDKIEKERRIKSLLEAIFNLWLRTQQTNYLTTSHPDMIVAIFRNDRSLMVGNKLAVEEDYRVKIEPLKEILRYHRDRISLVYIASFRSFISNFNELEALEKSEDLKDLHGKIFVSDMATLKDKLLSQDFKLIRE